MTDYFTADDITDNTLKGKISSDHITEATSEVNAIARSLGVDSDDIDSTAYEVITLAKDYACYLAALEHEGSALSNSFSNRDQDVFTSKKNTYWKKYLERKKSMTAEIFKGEADEAYENVPVIELYRC